MDTGMLSALFFGAIFIGFFVWLGLRFAIWQIDRDRKNKKD